MSLLNLSSLPGGQNENSEEDAEQLETHTPIAFTWGTLSTMVSFLDLAPDVLLVVDPAGIIVMITKQSETLFGYAQHELVGQTLEILVPERLRLKHMAFRMDYLREAAPRPMGRDLDLALRRKDGRELSVDISLQPIVLDHKLHVMAAVRDISAQRELVHVTERLHQQARLINLAHDAIIVRDAENRILSWNEGAERLYGWTSQEAIGKLLHILLQTQFPTPQEIVNFTLERHDQWEGELIHTCKDGSQVIIESRQAMVRDEKGNPSAILGINRDITERRRLERIEQETRAEMKARLEDMQAILNQMPTGAMLVRGDQLRLIVANQAANDLWRATWKGDQSLEDFLTEHDIHLLTTDGRSLSLNETLTRHAMRTGEPARHCQEVIRRADGTRLPILVSAIPLESSFRPSSIASETALSERVVLVVYEDVTSLKEAEALKDQFISLATHELRTPVTVIAGYVDMLLKQTGKGGEYELNEGQKKKLQEMKRSTQQLTKLTQDLLDVTRVQAGSFELHLQPTDLLALAQRVVERLQATTRQHQLSLRTSLSSLWATVDPERIEQVLNNLLSNAIKYSPEGGLIEITCEEHTKPHEARFSICDHGMGIPRAQQSRIFGLFVRAENVRTTQIRGTGLGLYLCRELVERHGGQIYFESEEGVGSTFFFSLPCDTAS